MKTRDYGMLCYEGNAVYKLVLFFARETFVCLYIFSMMIDVSYLICECILACVAVVDCHSKVL